MKSLENTTQPQSGQPSEQKINLESFRLLVSSVVDYAIFLLNPDGVVASWNAGAQRIKGYRAEEIIGQHFSKFYPQEAIDRKHPQHELKVATAEGRFEEEGWRVRKDGTLFWANVVITALRNEKGELVGFGKVTRDLTDRRQAEEILRQSEERMRLLLDAVKDYAIYMLDENGRVATWNPGAQRLKGYSAREIIGQHFSKFYTQEDIELGKPRREIEVATAEGRYEEEGWRIRKDGTRFWANVVLTAVKDEKGHLRGFAKVTRDLSERKLAEEERIRLAKTDEALRLRDEFLSLASHELRTPLTPITMHLQGMERGLERGEPVDREALSKARRQVRRLTRLVDDLLDFSRIQEGRIELEKDRVELDTIILPVIDDFRALNTRHRFAFRGAEVPVWVNADRYRLEQVIVNLLQNAVKYSPSGGLVSVELSLKGANIWISVTDQGIGIPDEDKARIFERFFRARNARIHNYSGLGLGLFVSNEIVTRHGGHFEVSSVQGQGTTFRFSLPIAAAVEHAPPATKRLLVADDDVAILEAMQSYLTREGYAVDTVADGEVAMQFIRQNRYDLLLIDLMMPVLDGAALIERLREEGLAQGVPIAIFSADSRAREKGLRLGADVAMRKPVDLDELLTVVKRLVARGPQVSQAVNVG